MVSAISYTAIAMKSGRLSTAKENCTDDTRSVVSRGDTVTIKKVLNIRSQGYSDLTFIEVQSESYLWNQM